MSDDYISPDEFLARSLEQGQQSTDSMGSMLGMIATMMEQTGASGRPWEYARVPWEQVNALACEGWELTNVGPYRDKWVMKRIRPVGAADLEALLA